MAYWTYEEPSTGELSDIECDSVQEVVDWLSDRAEEEHEYSIVCVTSKGTEITRETIKIYPSTGAEYARLTKRDLGIER